ncbi:hypothetical protein QQS21_003817 [Conoideocrella luteorostrata]|uniref:Glutathione S-transferase n=1 Tax=Conoideocrella luteorostrata TaxID=1105319 RepID=A0AAJ0CSJ0_9HYPO|nr:hypothetical protein QQS21_003817 [Conoideocrella luteorostrata]
MATTSTQPDITLYRANGSCAFVPHSVLKELSVPFNEVLLTWGAKGVEAADGSLTHDEYRKVHHLGYIPALQVDGTVITEMPAILTYIASLAPERKLLGGNALEQAKATEWMAYLSNSLHGMGFGMLFRPGRFTDDEGRYDQVKERGRAYVRNCYRRIDDLLDGGKYPVGSSESVVDFNLVIFWYWGLKNGFGMREEYPNYAALVRRMEGRDSVREVAQLEGIQLSF